MFNRMRLLQVAAYVAVLFATTLVFGQRLLRGNYPHGALLQQSGAVHHGQTTENGTGGPSPLPMGGPSAAR
jgi:hypothetical protein